MKLSELRKRGAIIDRAPVPKEVTWKRIDADGVEQSDTFTIHVKKLSFGEIEKLFAEDPADPSRSVMANVIAQSIFLGDGGVERFSYQDAYQLEASLAKVFLAAFNDVNGRRAGEPENPPKASSGTT